MQADSPPRSPARQAAHDDAPSTPPHQGIPPALEPPGAPRKPRGRYAWARKPRGDTSFLRAFSQELPAHEEAPDFGATRRSLEQQLERAWQERKRRSSAPRELDLVPRLGAERGPAEDEAESARPACFCCGSPSCPAALPPRARALAPRELSASAPPPQLHLDDELSSSSSAGELGRFVGELPASKRRRASRQQSLPCMPLLCKARCGAGGPPVPQRWLGAPVHVPAPRSS